MNHLLSDSSTATSPVVIEPGEIGQTWPPPVGAQDQAARLHAPTWGSSDSSQPRISSESMMQQAERVHRDVAVLHAFLAASAATGGYVQMLPMYHFCPIIKGSDEEPIPLYQFVEVLDGAVDYDHLKEEFPSLSYAQINGAILFLRRIAQYNSRGVDIDECEDENLANDPVLMEVLHQAIADQEISRVLNFNE